MPNKKKKPSKRQKAILTLLNIVESEGLHYGLVYYGGTEELKVVDDEELTKAVKALRDATHEIDAILDNLKDEVKEFVEDDSDF
jgi:ERCC4-type nuclease